MTWTFYPVGLPWHPVIFLGIFHLYHYYANFCPNFPFKVASCTLDASAKIYAGRVDSIHAQAYKMLGGLGRAEGNQGKVI